MEIRPLKETDDMLAVSNIYEKSWKHTYTGIIPDSFLNSIPSGQWANGLNQPGRHSLLLFDNGKLLGTSAFCKARIEDMADFGEIVSIYLLPEAEHKGYGKKLINAAIEELKKRGFRKIYLWVLEKNIHARQFYEHMGFKPNGKTMCGDFSGTKLQEIMLVYEEAFIK